MEGGEWNALTKCMCGEEVTGRDWMRLLPCKADAPMRKAAALKYGVLVATGAINMTAQFPPGAQDPHLPHPGAISARFDWNGSTEQWNASDFPESFVFRCFDEKGRLTARASAAWCIPVVEIETVSVDENGKPVAPTDADSISNTVYGPGHTFIEHTSSPPGLKRQRELDQRRQPGTDASPLRKEGSEKSIDRRSLYREQSGVSRNDRVAHGSESGLWARLKAWFGRA
jgi:hypothetical protein